MGCFTLGYVENLLIWLVALIVVFAIIRLVIPAAMSAIGGPPGGGVIFTIISYILWGIVAIFCIIIAFDLIACVAGSPFHTLR